MINYLKEKFSHKLILALIEVLIFYRMVLNLIYSTEQPYQTPKDLFFFYAALWLLLLVFILRKIPLHRKVVWATLIFGLLFMGGYFGLKKISPAMYGPDYYKIILFSWIMCIAFIALLVDFFCAGKSRTVLRNNWKVLVAFFVAAIIFLVYDGLTVIPILCPVVALLLTEIETDKWLNLTKSFAAGYYIAFVQTMTKSLIENPDRYQDGRYLGSFMELESGGAFCGGAVVCMLYFIALYILNEKKKWYKIALPLLLICYPIYAVLRITSRSTQISLIMVSLFFFIFIHNGKNKKTTIIRLGIALGACILAVVALMALSANINKRYFESNGQIELSYWESHLSCLTLEGGRYGYFGDDLFINGLDKLSSGRISHWAESSKQIRMLGHPFEPFFFENNDVQTLSPHNYFILWLIEYGIIGGGLAIFWFMFIGVSSAALVLKRDKNAVLLLLWFIFSFGVFSFTCVRWKSPIAYSFLILQYSLMIKTDDQSNSIEASN